jgi:hypothetical protein
MSWVFMLKGGDVLIGGCDVGRAGKPWMSEDRGNARLQQRVAITPNDLSSLQ